MDVVSGDKVFCFLHPQGQSDAAGQQPSWLFSAIVIYCSSSPQKLIIHTTVSFCGPLGSRSHGHKPWSLINTQDIQTRFKNSCLCKTEVGLDTQEKGIVLCHTKLLLHIYLHVFVFSFVQVMHWNKNVWTFQRTEMWGVLDLKAKID